MNKVLKKMQESPKHQAIAQLKSMTEQNRFSEIEMRLLRLEGMMDQAVADIRLIKSEVSHRGSRTRNF